MPSFWIITLNLCLTIAQLKVEREFEFEIIKFAVKFHKY